MDECIKKRCIYIYIYEYYLVGAREYYAKQNKSVREKEIPYDFTPIWNLRNKK